MDAPVARRLVIRGLVQGVGFRYRCVRAATEAGATGWVRNRTDGSVEAHVEGPTAAVENVLAWARVGPGPARVDAVEVRAVAPEGHREFTVR
ncbi:acylphosphatase [Occultella glacieicola]|uniref:Acylphosphatase n=1 Tax=Occultella glacieicola TaxID=2518684 RepID=A0ABY2E610_9MICO|nr:acylphosphatase [Occultella glacieicola]TDE95801.1 acylphosphatase [Occultella glacieicola]